VVIIEVAVVVVVENIEEAVVVPVTVPAETIALIRTRKKYPNP
jgi:hypothetical protein